MFFSVMLILFSLVAAACAVLIPVICARADRLESLERLPRARKPGMVLTALVILWCVPNIEPILEPGSSLLNWLYPLAILSIGLCIYFLDYLFARALAAFLILTAHYFLKEAFAARIYPFSAFLAAGLFLLGIAGILFGAKPYWFRDWIRLLFRDVRVRFGSALLLGYLAITGFIVSAAVLSGGSGGSR